MDVLGENYDSKVKQWKETLQAVMSGREKRTEGEDLLQDTQGVIRVHSVKGII